MGGDSLRAAFADDRFLSRPPLFEMSVLSAFCKLGLLRSMVFVTGDVILASSEALLGEMAPSSSVASDGLAVGDVCSPRTLRILF